MGHNLVKKTLKVVKISGNIIDDPAQLAIFLKEFAALPGAKILVHGGGKLATQIAEQMGLPQTLVEGRRVTDNETLRVVTMVYGGLVNKQIVAQLQSFGCTAIGVCGADGDLLRARKRPSNDIDYGLVGDIHSINHPLLDRWIGQGLTPVIAPLSHDGAGQLLNTNADTIAQEVAQALGKGYHVDLMYIFEKKGVLLDLENPNSRIPELSYAEYLTLRENAVISAGMIPKLDNAFAAIQKGVKKVMIGSGLEMIENGTSIVWET